MDASALTLGTLRLSQTGKVLTAAFEHPPHNFMTNAFTRDMLALVRAADRDESVGAVVLTGAPSGRFITHFDIDELSGAAQAPAPPLNHVTGMMVVAMGLATAKLPGGRRIWERHGGRLGTALAALSRLHAITAAIRRSGVTYLAAINGPCLGAGLELAAACDLRIAATGDTVRLGQPEVLGGIIPGAGGTQLLPRLIGAGPALELILEGRSLTAQQAKDCGLVNEVVAPQHLLAHAQQRAARLATRPRVAVACAKRAVNIGAGLPLGAGLLIEAGGLVASGKSAHSQQLAAAYTRDLNRLGDSPFVAEPEPWIAGER